MEQHLILMKQAIELAREGMRRNEGGPFGAVVVKDGKIVGRGWNRVTSTNDPTAHAEIMAIRDAAQSLGRFHLEDCQIYCTCEPCPMCLSAIYWAHIDSIFYASSSKEAASAGFDDAQIYSELGRLPSERTISMTAVVPADMASDLFMEWEQKADKRSY